MPLPTFWFAFFNKHGRSPRAGELSPEQHKALEESFVAKVERTRYDLSERRKSLQKGERFSSELHHRTRRKHLEQCLTALVNAQIDLQELRGEPFVDIHELVTEPEQ